MIFCYTSPNELRQLNFTLYNIKSLNKNNNKKKQIPACGGTIDNSVTSPSLFRIIIIDY